MAISSTKDPDKFSPVHHNCLKKLFFGLGMDGPLEHSIHRSRAEAESFQITFRTFLRSVQEFRPDSAMADFLDKHVIRCSREYNPELQFWSVKARVRKRFALPVASN